MINFCYDKLVNAAIGHPNLATWTAKPYTPEWRQFDYHWPKTIPLRLLMYFDHSSIEYCIHSVESAPVGSWYPIAVSWFDFDCDYVALVSDAAKVRIKNKEIKILFYYHEGDNPMRIKIRLDELCWQNNLPAESFIFVSANSAADNIDQCIYFQEHESFFRYVNRKQVDKNKLYPMHDFTMLSRTHKWWRASCAADLYRKQLLNNSIWSYHVDCVINDDPADNPIELDSEPGWRQAVDDFVKNGPYTCDDLSLQQQNDHHWVNVDLYKKSFFHIIMETHFDADQSDGTFITEKTWKCIKYGQPFVVVGPAGTLAALRNSGYQVFDSVLDNSYDEIKNNTDRWVAVRTLITDLHQSSIESLYRQCQEDVEHNMQLFSAREIQSLNTLIEKLQCQI